MKAGCIQLAAVISMLSVASGWGQIVSDYALKIGTGRLGGIYEQGGNVVFYAHLSLKGLSTDGAVQWRISKDGVMPPMQSGTVTVTNGVGEISASLNEPGFLQCAVEYKTSSGSSVTETAGAAVDPLKIQPSLPVPDDFDHFWSAEKQKLAAIPLNVRMTPVKSPIEGVECFDLQADSVRGPLSAYLARPVAAKGHSLPAMILPHGAGVTSSRLGLAARWAGDGFLALDFNVHGLPNGKPASYYEQLAKGELSNYFFKGKENREDYFFHDAFLRVIRAIDVVAAQPEWDGRILIANGRSQGGGQAIAAAGLDSRVTFLCAEVPALCDHSGTVVGRISGWPRLLGPARLPANGASPMPDDRSLQVSRYFDCVNFASRIKVPAFFTVGFIDKACPPTSVYAAYNQIRSPKSILNLPQFGHQQTREGDEGVHQAINEYLKTARKPNVLVQ